MKDFNILSMKTHKRLIQKSIRIVFIYLHMETGLQIVASCLKQFWSFVFNAVMSSKSHWPILTID